MRVSNAHRDLDIISDSDSSSEDLSVMTRRLKKSTQPMMINSMTRSFSFFGIMQHNSTRFDSTVDLLLLHSSNILNRRRRLELQRQVDEAATTAVRRPTNTLTVMPRDIFGGSSERHDRQSNEGETRFLYVQVDARPLQLAIDWVHNRVSSSIDAHS